MTENTQRNEAFRSAMQRLPMAVIVVDGNHRLQPHNERAAGLFEAEGLTGDLLEIRPRHPLSMLITEILHAESSPPERTLTFPSGNSYRVESSRRSDKGMNRWLMVLVTPVAAPRSVETIDLTPREHAVTRMMIEGSSSNQICDALSITRDTLKSHLRRIFEKTGTRSRAALVAFLLRRE